MRDLLTNDEGTSTVHLVIYSERVSNEAIEIRYGSKHETVALQLTSSSLMPQNNFVHDDVTAILVIFINRMINHYLY